VSADTGPAARWSKFSAFCGGVIFFGLVSCILLSRATERNLNHDEHQFVAPAVLLAREGLQPYRDFPLFHVPNLVFLDAAVIRLLDEPLMAARCLSVLCALGTAVLVFREAWQTVPGQARWRFMLAAGSVILLIFDPLFSFTTARAWNHDSAAFFTVLAIFLQVRAARWNSMGNAAASAICGGLAAGTRLTYAPILIPLWMSVWAFPCSFRRRSAIACLYVAAAALALAPSWFYLITAPEEFVFGNFEFPRLRLFDPDNERIRKTMHPLRKLRFFFKEVALPSLPLFLGYSVIAWKSLRTPGNQNRASQSFGPALVFGIIPFALLGCFAPSRYQYQHFFIVTPLLVLGLIYGLGSAEWTARRARTLLFGSLLVIVTNSIIGLYKINDRLIPSTPANWFPYRVRNVGQRIRSHLTAGPVLTLAPVYPLEGDLSIYPEFATGAFGWRSAPFASPELRRAMKLIAPDDLEVALRDRPPAAIFTGVEEESLEKPFVAYARAHSFRSIDFGNRRTLWLPP